MSGAPEQRVGARPRRPATASSFLAAVAVALVAGLAILIATLAAATGPSEVFAGDGPLDRMTAESPAATVFMPDDGREEDLDRILREGTDNSLAWVGTVVHIALVVLVVVALVLTAVLYPWRRRRRRTAEADEGDVDPSFAIVDPFAAVSQALVADSDEQDAALRLGTPRNGIVEAWLRFEVQAVRAGLPREEWETSSEFTSRFLTAVQADTEAVADLSDLFRIARFSDHELGEVERERAAVALARIRGSLVTRAHGTGAR